MKPQIRSKSGSLGAVLPHVGPKLFVVLIQNRGSRYLPPQSTRVPQSKLPFKLSSSSSPYLHIKALSTWTCIDELRYC